MKSIFFFVSSCYRWLLKGFAATNKCFQLICYQSEYQSPNQDPLKKASKTKKSFATLVDGSTSLTAVAKFSIVDVYGAPRYSFEHWPENERKFTSYLFFTRLFNLKIKTRARGSSYLNAMRTERTDSLFV